MIRTEYPIERMYYKLYTFVLYAMNNSNRLTITLENPFGESEFIMYLTARTYDWEWKSITQRDYFILRKDMMHEMSTIHANNLSKL